MSYLNKNRIVHRNIKLSNILIEGEDDNLILKISNFKKSLILSDS